LSVRDNGGGFEEDTSTVTEGVGLSNTRERLLHRFGEGARLELSSPRAGGGEVTLFMPYERQEAA
jgi:signal transduction histidine kinase